MGNDPESLATAAARGGPPPIDPTKNVIALVEANAKAAAALRRADTKFNDAKARHLKEIGKLRAAHAETLRVSDLDRLDKTRQVDVLAGTASAAALATAVQTLANTSDRNAETLRNLVNATAATMAKQTSDQAQLLSAQTDNLVKDINSRIAELQKSSYQGAGKSEGISSTTAILIAVGGLAVAAVVGFFTIIAGLAAIGGVLYAVLKP
jgi:hypothetical protein